MPIAEPEAPVLPDRGPILCGLAAHPSARWYMNCVPFQLAMLAYDLKLLAYAFQPGRASDAEELKHTTLATARLRFRFQAAKLVRHAGAVLCDKAISTRNKEF